MQCKIHSIPVITEINVVISTEGLEPIPMKIINTTTIFFSRLVLLAVHSRELGQSHGCWCPASLQWRHNGRDGVSNHQPHHCLLNRLFRCRSKKTSKLRVTELCAGNSPETGEFPAQRASYAENVSIWWRHHSPCVTKISTAMALLMEDKQILVGQMEVYWFLIREIWWKMEHSFYGLQNKFSTTWVIQCGAVKTRSTFSQIFTKIPHRSPVRASYGKSFVDSASDWYSASVSVIIYVIYYNIGPHYKGNWLYFVTSKLRTKLLR